MNAPFLGWTTDRDVLNQQREYWGAMNGINKLRQENERRQKLNDNALVHYRKKYEGQIEELIQKYGEQKNRAQKAYNELRTVNAALLEVVKEAAKPWGDYGQTALMIKAQKLLATQGLLVETLNRQNF